LSYGQESELRNKLLYCRMFDAGGTTGISGRNKYGAANGLKNGDGITRTHSGVGFFVFSFFGCAPRNYHTVPGGGDWRTGFFLMAGLDVSRRG